MKASMAPIFWILAFFIVILMIGGVYTAFTARTADLAQTGSDLLVGGTAKVDRALTNCQLWRAPPIFFDPAALGASTISSVNEITQSGCDQNNPVACEFVCACLLRLQRYCNIGETGYDNEQCLNDPCRLQLGG